MSAANGENVWAELGWRANAGPADDARDRQNAASVRCVETDEREILLAEYGSLRDEQLKRMDHRITLIAASLTVTATLVGVGLERESGPLLLITPVVACLFGLLHIYHHVAIREIGYYIQDHLEVPLAEGLGLSGWQGWHVCHAPAGSRFRRLLGLWHLPIVCVTLVPSLVALGLSQSFGTAGRIEVPLVIIDALFITLYIWLYLYEGLRRKPPMPIGAEGDESTTSWPCQPDLAPP